MKIKLKPQECPGDYKFDGKLVMTSGFAAEFGDLAPKIAINTLIKIWKERVNSPEGADYLQVCEFDGVKYWLIDDIEVVTALLPSDY